MKSTLMIGLSLVAVLAMSGCGSKNETAQPMATVVAPKSAVVQLPVTELIPVTEPAVVASAPVVAVPVMPSVFSAPTPKTQIVSPGVTDNQLFSTALKAGYESKLDAIPAIQFIDSGSKWARLAADIRNGKPDPAIEQLSMAPWTKQIAYVRAGKSVVFAVLVNGTKQISGAGNARQIMVVVAGLNQKGDPMVVSVENVPFVDRNFVYAPVLTKARAPLDLQLGEFFELREALVEALRT